MIIYRMSHQYWANFDRSNGVVRIDQFSWNFDIFYWRCKESLSFWFLIEIIKIADFLLLANFFCSFQERSKLMPFQILPLAFFPQILYHLLPICILGVQNSLPLAVFIESAHLWKMTSFPLLFQNVLCLFEYEMMKVLSLVDIGCHFFYPQFHCQW